MPPSPPATTPPSVCVWTLAVFVLFLTRALLFNTWVSRGPDVQRLLGVNTVELGLVTMLVPLGGLLAIGPASRLLHHLGARRLAAAGYLLASASLALAGLIIAAGNLPLTCVLLLLLGAPLAVVDFVGNYEGTLVDKAARRSVFAAIHGAFGLGMLSAAGVTGLVSDAGMPLGTHFVIIAAVSLLASLGACLGLPRPSALGRRESAIRAVSDDRPTATGERTPSPEPTPTRPGSVWGESRSQLIALIGFSFIMAETSAGTWVPIALTGSGFSTAQAAYALGLFWVLVTVGRLLGGFVVDAIGRFRTVLVSCLVTAAGLATFMAAVGTPLSLVGLALWGAGLALGFPMSVASMSDDPIRAAARVNMIVTIVYLSNICVGPALGAVGQAFGVSAAFVVPLLLLLISAGVAKVTKPAAG